MSLLSIGLVSSVGVEAALIKKSKRYMAILCHLKMQLFFTPKFNCWSARLNRNSYAHIIMYNYYAAALHTSFIAGEITGIR